jgi:DNA-binding CsgD family transcriptional regulator
LADTLTVRQREILDGLAGGRTQKELARELGIGISTLQGHVRGMLAVLSARTVAQAVDIAHRSGVFAAPRPVRIRRVWDNDVVIAHRRSVLVEGCRTSKRPA